MELRGSAAPGRLAARPLGSRRVYRWSLLGWSVVTIAQAGVGCSGAAAAATLFGLRLGLGAAEAPSFPANSRLVAVWFPTAERGLASAIFNAAQYFSTVLFYPIMGTVTHAFGWSWVFVLMGATGLVFGLAWNRLVHEPADHPMANAAEVDYIRAGGGLVDLDTPRGRPLRRAASADSRAAAERMLIGIFLASTASTSSPGSPDLVPDLPGQEARHVDLQVSFVASAALRGHRRRARRLDLGHAAAARRPAQRRAQGADRRCCSRRSSSAATTSRRSGP